MPIHYSPTYFIHYLLKREATQFFTSLAIRYLAIGMVLIFEPIYIYLYFEKSISFTLLYFAVIHGLYAVLAVYGGRVMARLGLRHSILISHFFYFAYFVCLFFLYESFLLLPLAIILKVFGISLFWPSFHVDFARFSEKDHRGRQVGRKNIAIIIPTVAAPIIGGWILASFGYQVLFIAVLLILLASAIPLFLSKEVHEMYSDSYKTAWRRIFKKENRKNSLAFAFQGMEVSINFYIWPIFMTILALQYSLMGGITSFSLALSALFVLYAGRISDKGDRSKLLDIGAVLSSIAWVVKYFVTTPFGAFLSHGFYRVCRSTLGVPFQTILYEKTALKGPEGDEFIIYREIVVNLSKFFMLLFLSILFLFTSEIRLAFLLGALFVLGFMFLGDLPKLNNKLWTLKSSKK
ncbi:MFS transporter [Patescibacteria group bacterium]